jgi:hypothetical protein
MRARSSVRNVNFLTFETKRRDYLQSIARRAPPVIRKMFMDAIYHAYECDTSFASSRRSMYAAAHLGTSAACG